MLGELVESIVLEESLDEISLRAAVGLVATPDLPDLVPGQSVRISGIPFGGSDMADLLNPGVLWDWSSRDSGQKHIDLTIYDRTIYLSKSEDEMLMSKGQTASQRLSRYAQNWGIPLAGLEESSVPLSRSLYRAQTIYSMIQADLKETAAYGGEMYRPRMTPDGLELFRLGSNTTVWSLELERNVLDVAQRQTLDGAVTQVKVLGSELKARAGQGESALSEETETTDNNGEDPTQAPSLVLAIEKGDIARYGTLQKMVQDSKGSIAEARTQARQMLSGIQETFTVSGIDINIIRAGDRIELAGSGLELLVTSVRHELGVPGRMSLELATPDYVRRKYYGSV
ncbi:XkdQ/YqbQ family protein [Paenibacillus thalictri]|nr:phage portal protein [Paenibacillus thalictri]